MIMTGQLVCSFRTSDFVDFSNPVWPLHFFIIFETSCRNRFHILYRLEFHSSFVDLVFPNTFPFLSPQPPDSHL